MEAVPPIPMALTVLEMVQICGESLEVGTSDENNVRESSVWEELVDKIRTSIKRN